MSAGFAAALLLAGTAFALRGVGTPGIGLGLRLTARLAFLLFWPCYTASALVVLFGPSFMPVKRRARDLGLAFATVLAVHLTLVCAVCAIGAAPSARVFIIFGLGAACALLLSLLSIPAVSQMIDADALGLMRSLSMNYLAFDFADDFVRREPLHSVTQQLAYLPFAAFALLGPALRLLAWLKVRGARIKAF